MRRSGYQTYISAASHLTRVLTVAALTVSLMTLSPAFQADRYVRATVDDDGQLRIRTADGQTIEPPKEREQVGFSRPQISPNGEAVGWLAEYPNCCTSYPIPLKLIILRNGNLRPFTGNGLPVWHWGFQADGAQFAMQQETVHGGLGIHYELHDVISGSLIAEYDPAVGPDNRTVPSQIIPKWVKELDSPLRVAEGCEELNQKICDLC
jgi:hypothetical protein